MLLLFRLIVLLYLQALLSISLTKKDREVIFSQSDTFVSPYSITRYTSMNKIDILTF